MSWSEKDGMEACVSSGDKDGTVGVRRAHSLGRVVGADSGVSIKGEHDI